MVETRLRAPALADSAMGIGWPLRHQTKAAGAVWKFRVPERQEASRRVSA
jgi:hypothetical protein